jgi:hypothetical protein
MDFRWTPNKPLDPRIPERMRAAFPMPSEPPPDAEFWPETKSYSGDLMAALRDRDEVELMRYLTSMGVKRVEPYSLWAEWFLYLLPDLIEMSFNVKAFEYHGPAYKMGLQPDIVHYLMNIYIDGFVEEYPGFREDLLESVGQVVMSPQWWSSPETLREFFDNSAMERDELVEWNQFQGWTSNFRASMFLCLRFLNAPEIAGWVDSIAAIDTDEWRRSVTGWLRAFQRMQMMLEHPEKLAVFRQSDREPRYTNDSHSAEYLLEITGLSWWNSFFVFLTRPADMLKTFFPADNLAAFWDTVHRHDWLREAVSGDAE